MARPKNHRPRENAVEIERRLLKVQAWLIECIPYGVMIQSIYDNWGYSKRQAERMITKAKSRWIPEEEEKLSTLRKFRIQRLDHIGRKMKPEFAATPQGIRTLLMLEKEKIQLEGTRPTKLMIEAEIAKDQGKQADPLSTSDNILTIEVLPTYEQNQAIRTSDQGASMS